MALLDSQYLHRELNTAVIGQRLEIIEELDSTNNHLLALSEDPAAHGAVVIAERQTAGRGRLSRAWHSPKGASLMLSVLLRLHEDEPAARTMLLWTALAVRQAVADVNGVHADIKWPNDLVVQGRKLCGILIESRAVSGGSRAYVIGIGLNCLQHANHFPPELRTRATSLELECTEAVDRAAVARGVIIGLDHWHEQARRRAPEWIRDAWLGCALSLGDRLHLRQGGEEYTGRVVELDPQASIVLELEGGGRRLFDPHTTSVG